MPGVLSVLLALVLNDSSQCLLHFWNLLPHGPPSASLCVFTGRSFLCVCAQCLPVSLPAGTPVILDLVPSYSSRTSVERDYVWHDGIGK